METPATYSPMMNGVGAGEPSVEAGLDSTRLATRVSLESDPVLIENASQQFRNDPRVRIDLPGKEPRLL